MNDISTEKEALHKGEIGRLYGVKVLKTNIYIKDRPRWFPGRWLWYRLAGLFTDTYTTDYQPATTSRSKSL